MGLRDIEATLPPGFRFCPSDEELVCHYLYKKIANDKLYKGISMVEVNLHLCEPWQLPDAAKVGDNEWYFFSFRDRKYSTGYRSNRATTNGFWKATGKDRPVTDPTTKAIVGMRKTLVFYLGRAPHGLKTGWVMHEFRLENQHLPPKEDWVLCRVIHKAKEQQQQQFSINHGMEDDSGIDTTISCSSPTNLPSSPHHVGRTMETEHHQQQLILPSLIIANDDDTNNYNASAWSCSFLEHQEKESHEEEFMFDMGLENVLLLGDEEMPCLDDDNNSVVMF